MTPPKRPVSRISGEALATLKVCLDRLQEQGAVSAAMVATLDGFELASFGISSEVAKIAAIASSMLAVARALGEEIHEDSCERLVVEMPSVRVLICAIDRQDMLLWLMGPTRTSLGAQYVASRDCALALTEQLAAHAAVATPTH
jgi:predicted regulator of Ras-like GTPase activity (Roadblock/LC7/MglB family)